MADMTALEVEAAHRAAALERLAATEPSRVVSYYTGRPGCACGCRGTHRDVIPGKPAAVKRLLTMLRKRLEGEEWIVEDFGAFDDGWWVDVGARTYIIYFS